MSTLTVNRLQRQGSWRAGPKARTHGIATGEFQSRGCCRCLREFGLRQGEARVRQGAVEKTLRPGEQMATNPSMELSTVIQEIAWSPRAGAHMALLQQSVVAPANSREAATPKWEVVSVRPCNPNPGGGEGVRGGGGAGTGNGPTNQVDLERLFLSCQTTRQLVMAAHGNITKTQRGTAEALYSSHTFRIVGPAWIESELYTIEAKAERPVDRDVMSGPMLQAILEDRFKLKLRRENRDIPVIALTVAKGGPKLQPHQEGSCVDLNEESFVGRPRGERNAALAGKPPCGVVRQVGLGRPPSPQRRKTEEVIGLTVEEFIRVLVGGSPETYRTPVVDQTALTGRFDFKFEYGWSPEEIKNLVQGTARGFSGQGRLESDFDTSPTLYEALENQLGLKLVKTKGPWPHLVIEHVERPSPN